MYSLVLALCLTLPATASAPAHQGCTLVTQHEKYDTLKECNGSKLGVVKKLETLDSDIKIKASECVDSTKVKTVPDSANKAPTAPPSPPAADNNGEGLKPLTPEQRKQGFESL